MGWPAQPGRAGIHGDGATPGSLAGALSDDCRLQSQHVRRRGERPARSPTARRRGKLRHRKDETQTRIPGQIDQPVLLEGNYWPRAGTTIDLITNKRMSAYSVPGRKCTMPKTRKVTMISVKSPSFLKRFFCSSKEKAKSHFNLIF